MSLVWREPEVHSGNSPNKQNNDNLLNKMTNKNLYLIYQYRKRNDAYHHKLAELKYLGKLIAHVVKKKKEKKKE